MYISQTLEIVKEIKSKKDKLERIVTSYDQFQKLDLQLPQVARWLPGYGFAVWVITSKTDPTGQCVSSKQNYVTHIQHFQVIKVQIKWQKS